MSRVPFGAFPVTGLTGPWKVRDRARDLQPWAIAASLLLLALAAVAVGLGREDVGDALGMLAYLALAAGVVLAIVGLWRREAGRKTTANGRAH